MIIQLDKWDLLRVKEFAHHRSMNTKLYRSRGNFKYSDISKVLGSLRIRMGWVNDVLY